MKKKRAGENDGANEQCDEEAEAREVEDDETGHPPSDDDSDDDGDGADDGDAADDDDVGRAP